MIIDVHTHPPVFTPSKRVYCGALLGRQHLPLSGQPRGGLRWSTSGRQSFGNELLFPGGLSGTVAARTGVDDIECRERLAGLLKYYYRKAG